MMNGLTKPRPLFSGLAAPMVGNTVMHPNGQYFFDDAHTMRATVQDASGTVRDFIVKPGA